VRLVNVVSLGYRTDLALLRAGGTVVEDRGDSLVVRSPHNPAHWWGNFLLLDRPPPAAEALGWLERFVEAFPGAGHVAFGVDGTQGQVSDLEPWTDVGLVAEAQAVMTASAVRPPLRRADAVCRALASDDDWAQSVELRVRCSDGPEEPAGFRAYASAQARTRREMVDAGHGGWFGAFAGERLVCQMGLVAAGPGLTRFQSVETDPQHRRRGLAGTLVAHVSRFGLETLRARTLVMVADPAGPAIGLYRSLGFTVAETQLQAELPRAWRS
jgi:ribosomal protein S18 acetylase RimI-like enzyme